VLVASRRLKGANGENTELSVSTIRLDEEIPFLPEARVYAETVEKRRRSNALSSHGWRWAASDQQLHVRFAAATYI
jgi:hypothetical protein